MADYPKKTVADLQEILKSRGLSHTGKKAELVARLQESDKASTASADAEPIEPASESVPEAPPKLSATTTTTSAPSDTVQPTAEPTAPSPDTTLATTTNYALNLPTESLDDEALRRKKRAERFGISDEANGVGDGEAAKRAQRAQKFGASGPGLGKLNEALPTERERGPKRRKEGAAEDAAMDDPGLIRRGGGRGGFRGRHREKAGRRGGTPDRPTGVRKQTSYLSEKDRAAAEARKARFAAAS